MNALNALHLTEKKTKGAIKYSFMTTCVITFEGSILNFSAMIVGVYADFFLCFSIRHGFILLILLFGWLCKYSSILKILSELYLYAKIYFGDSLSFLASVLFCYINFIGAFFISICLFFCTLWGI